VFLIEQKLFYSRNSSEQYGCFHHITTTATARELGDIYMSPPVL